jgi:hypothetical protein
MRLFMNEFRKIWNLRIVAILAAIAVPFSVVFLIGFTDSYNSLSHYGNFGEYQNEMYDKYGATLELEELADFDVEAVRTRVIAEGNEIISQHQVFADNLITNYDEYESFRESWQQNWNELTEQERESLSVANNEMDSAFRGGLTTMYASYRSVPFRLQQLDAIDYFYTNAKNAIEVYIDFDVRPVVVSVLKEILADGTGNLVNGYLAYIFSEYMVSVAVFAIVSIVLLIAPVVVTDRTRGIHMLQYSSKAGRRLFSVQFAATLTSAALLGVAMCALSFIPWLFTNAPQYWDDSLRQFGNWGVFLYDVTFRQYALLFCGAVAALCAAASGIAFILARFSDSIISLMLKAVPVAAAISGLAYCALYRALQADNLIFTSVFRGEIAAPELWSLIIVSAAAICSAALVVAREKRADVV